MFSAGSRRDRFQHRLTDLRFCCAANVVTASEAREVEGCRDCSNPMLGSLALRAHDYKIDCHQRAERHEDDASHDGRQGRGAW